MSTPLIESVVFFALLLYGLGVIISCVREWDMVRDSYDRWDKTRLNGDASFYSTRVTARSFLKSALLAPVRIVGWPVVATWLAAILLSDAVRDARA